jgi:DASH complex subunit SPC19
LRDEIGPFVALLLDRADKQLDRQARRVETLKARADLNAGRLSSSNTHHDAELQRQRPWLRPGTGSTRLPTNQVAGKVSDSEAALRARVVRQRREALKYSVERLELEVLQKERELRLRLDKA